MFAIVAGLVFSIAFILALGTMVVMFALYRDKMIAALLFEPIPETAPVYNIAIRRPRMQMSSQRRQASMPVGIFAAA